MYRAARILIEALGKSVAIEEAAADALFAAALECDACGAPAEAEATRQLSRMQRIKAMGLRSQIGVLRVKATLHFMQTRLGPPL